MEEGKLEQLNKEIKDQRDRSEGLARRVEALEKVILDQSKHHSKHPQHDYGSWHDGF